ncbi:MAG: hypothetical protein CMN86_07640 [Stappia sp.]|nr:hypothetical protein [Stappia sp.]
MTVTPPDLSRFKDPATGGTPFLRAFLIALLVLLPVKLAFSAAFPGREIASIRSWYEAKRERLAALPRPRVVLAGGSATYFGLDAGWLSRTLDRPVMNFGLHAGMGAITNLRLAVDASAPGDTVVWSPEYDTLLERSLDTDLSSGLRLAIGDLSVIAPSTMLQVLTMPTGLTAGFGMRRHGPYSVSVMTAHGDVGIARPHQMTAEKLCFATTAESINEEILRQARTMAETARVRLILRPGQFPDLPCNDGVEKLAADMLAEAARLGIETIGNAASARVPVDWYYDTTYHLTEKGAEAQSERLAPLLEQALGRS